MPRSLKYFVKRAKRNEEGVKTFQFRVGYRVSENNSFSNCPRFCISGYCLIKSFSLLSSVEKIRCLTSEFQGKFHAKIRYHVNHNAMSAKSLFGVKFTSLAMIFS